MFTTALDYLQTLSELMLSMAVTDRRGVEIDLAQGGDEAVEYLLSVGASHSKVMLVGNGGSASIVSHIQNDICKAVGIRAMVFTEQPLLTALANDSGYESVYEWPVEQWSETGDLFWAVSSSGKSENILRAAKTASDKGCNIITMTGFSADNPLRKMGDLNFYVSSHVYGYVEIAHAGLSHFITDRARPAIPPSLSPKPGLDS